ncbi:MAG TPA: hypothetical protein VMG58_14570 [Candidatus Sulfotelmatobacter sp.]|nr:hypothetical protein [Candidatus Sulfotelmatobacter sp.]
MQAYQVEFLPARQPAMQITDAIRAMTVPHPHVPVGDPATPGKGTRIPLTSRLVASLRDGPPLIARAKAYRDPKTGAIVLGVEQEASAEEARALVLLTASSNFPDGLSATPQAEVVVLARGDIRHGQQLLLIWPDGGRILIEDPARDERYALERSGNQFDRVEMPLVG